MAPGLSSFTVEVVGLTSPGAETKVAWRCPACPQMLRIPSGRSVSPHGPPLQRARMSESDVTVFHRFHEAWTRGDVPAALELVDTEVVARPLHGVLFSRSEFRGRDGIAAWYREMTEPWDRFTAIVEEAHDTPEGVKGLLRVTGYRGGEPFHARVGVVCQMRGGRILTLTARNVGDVERELRS